MNLCHKTNHLYPLVALSLLWLGACRSGSQPSVPDRLSFEGQASSPEIPEGTQAAEDLAIQRQQRLNWCWAACIQGVLAQARVFQSQEQIATRLTGWPQDRPAYIGELVALAQSYGFRAWNAGRPATPLELQQSLQSGWKLIAFVLPTNGPVGHYVLLEQVDMNGMIWISDPATGATTPFSLNDLYYRWRWQDSVVIGR